MKIDLLCENYSKAKRNRKMVRLKQNIEGYIFMEEFLKRWPHRKKLPEWMYGEVPNIGKHEAKELHKYGIHITDDYYGED